MSASRPTASDPRTQQRKEVVSLAVLSGGAIALFAAGFRSGWNRGRVDLLRSLDRALRIQQALTKED